MRLWAVIAALTHLPGLHLRQCVGMASNTKVSRNLARRSICIDQNGAPITEAAFKGHPTALFFGFTHCPEVCPTTLFEMAGLAEDAWR